MGLVGQVRGVGGVEVVVGHGAKREKERRQVHDHEKVAYLYSQGRHTTSGLAFSQSFKVVVIATTTSINETFTAAGC